MAILVLTTSAFVEQQLVALRAQAPDETFYTDPATAPPGDVEALLAFKLAPGIAPRFPGLRFVASAGAGADELLAAADLSPRHPIVRAVDPLQGAADGAVRRADGAAPCRDLPRSRRSMPKRGGSATRPLPEAAIAIGVMGCGAIGGAERSTCCAAGLCRGRLDAHAARRATIETYCGAEGCKPFLARSARPRLRAAADGETRGAPGRAGVRGVAARRVRHQRVARRGDA